MGFLGDSMAISMATPWTIRVFHFKVSMKFSVIDFWNFSNWEFLFLFYYKHWFPLIRFHFVLFKYSYGGGAVKTVEEINIIDGRDQWDCDSGYFFRCPLQFPHNVVSFLGFSLPSFIIRKLLRWWCALLGILWKGFSFLNWGRIFAYSLIPIFWEKWQREGVM